MKHPNVYSLNTQEEFFTPERCHIVEVLNVDSHAASSIARARVEPGVTTQNHLLRDTVEFYCILEGEGEMFLNNQPAGIVKSGTVVHIPANIPQYIRNNGDGDLVFLCFCMPRFRVDVYEALGD